MDVWWAGAAAARGHHTPAGTVRHDAGGGSGTGSGAAARVVTDPVRAGTATVLQLAVTWANR